MASYSQSEEDSQSSVLNISQQLGKSDVDVLVPATKIHLNQSADEAGQDSLVGSKSIMELKKLTQTESLFLTLSSSAFSSPRRPNTEDGASMSVKDKPNKLQNSSFSTSLNAGAPSSQLLTSNKHRQDSVGQESLNLNFPPTQAQVPVPTAASYQAPAVSGTTGKPLVLSKSVLRTEPEGCSAAPPDQAPNQLLIQPPQQLSSPVSSADEEEEEEEEGEEEEEEGEEEEEVEVEEEEEVEEEVEEEEVEEENEEAEVGEEEEVMTTMSADPAQSVASSAAVQEETDQEVMSEDSSQSSLTRRVSTLLQDNDSIPGQQCRPLPLDVEDQRKIEEIKRELLLKNPLKVLMSTDTESSTTSGFRVQSLDGSSSSADTYAANRPGNVFLYEPQQSPIVDLTEPSMQCQTQAQTDLEAKVCEIAAREGVRIPTNQALTSITITTCRRSSPSSSPTTLNSTPEPLQLIELSSDQPTAAHLQFQTNEQCTQTNGLFEPPLTTEDQIVSSLSAVEGLTRQETVGGQSAQSSQVSDGEDVQKQRAQASQTHQSSLATTGHVSHVHLTLFPKSTLQTLTSDPFRTSNVAPLLPHRDFAPIRHSSSRGNSPDEGVGSASPQEWSDVREPARLQATRRAAMFRSADPLRIATGTSTIAHRVETSLRVPAAAAPVPLLLPYKPPGSEQLFYMPQTQADVTSTETTMESSHTGSDDAVPPHFNSDILGRRDSGLDRGVSIRHTEGIYSKRLKTNSFKMQDPLSRDAAVAEDETASTSMPSVIHQGPVRRDQGAVRRDQGTSFVPEPAPQLSRLDLLWQMFLEQWVEEKSRPTRDSDVNLVELLERLSHLIDRSRAGRLFHKREEELQGSQQQKRGGTEHRRTARNMEVQGNKESKLRHQTSQSTSFSSSSIFQSTATMCSMSTVDTTRLAQAYGADKVQHLKSSSSLRKLYSTIKKQREEEERRSNDDIITITPSENTNQSAEMDSTLSTSKYVVPAQRGPSKTLAAKRAVKLVNKSIQAGDLEIVSNGTQRHTRDVGTTFPSPVPVRASGQISTSSSSTWRERGAHRSPSKSHRVHRQRKNKKSPGKPYRAGVSWFISGDCVRLEARKENWAEQDMDQSPHTSNGSWIDSYSTESSWREPLRQKQIHQDSNQHNYHHHYHHHHHSDQRNKPVSTGLIPLTLQEALETQRPDFILRSTERMKRLALQAEERRQWMLSHQEREELLTMERRQWLPKPAGSNSQRRAISRKEMIHRSKQIYENLPEVQRRKEEEKRKKDYQSYRLNAKLLNMRITNQVLRKRLNHQQEYYY